MVHSGFWQILAATGSRFVGAAPTFPAGYEDGFPASGGGGLEMFPQTPPVQPARRGATAPAGEGKPGRKRLSVDMISRPGGFT